MNDVSVFLCSMFNAMCADSCAQRQKNGGAIKTKQQTNDQDAEHSTPHQYD